MYIQIGDYEKAEAAAGKLIESFSNAEGIAAAIEDVADKYQMAGSHAKSYPLHRYVVEHWPGNERAIWCQMKAIMSQLRLGDLAKAEQELGTLLSDFAGHKELGPAVHEVVEEYRDTGAHVEGRELFAYIMENWDETPDTMLELQVGVALQSIKLGELDKADGAVEKLIAEYNDHPKIAKGLFQIAEQHYYAKNYRDCIKILKLIEAKYAASDFPTKAEVPFLIASCYKRLKEYGEAIEYYKRTIERFPQSRFAKGTPYLIGMIYMSGTYEDEKAIEWFEKQVELYREYALGESALFYMGAIYVERLGDYQKGQEVLERCLELYPKGQRVSGCLQMLTVCREKLGK